MIMPTFVVEKSPCYYSTSSAKLSDHYISPRRINITHSNYWLRSEVSSASPGPALEPEDIGESSVVEPTTTPTAKQLSYPPKQPIKPGAASHGGTDSDRLTCLLESFSRATRGKISTLGQSVCRKILTFIANPNRGREYMQFCGVYSEEYSELLRFIEDTSYISSKPRFSYIPEDHILLVEMPSALHEAPFAGFKDVFSNFFASLPYDRKVVNIEILNTVSISSGVSPDQRISFHKLGSRRSNKFIYTMIGETALSQDVDSLLTKLRKAVAANPQLLLIIMILIEEQNPFHSPLWNSLASRRLLQQPFHQESGDFLAQSDDDSVAALNVPVSILGHKWCSVGSISFKVWVRGDDPIDIDTDDVSLMAEGTLYPVENMDAVNNMIETGARALQRGLALFTQEINPDIDIHAIQDPSIPFHLDISMIRTKLVSAMEETAYSRYRVWYDEAIRKRKVDVIEGNAGEASTPAANTRSRRGGGKPRGRGRGRGGGGAGEPLPQKTSKRRK
ncbi:hypothetical protein DFJ58DRAFT_729040 [Suillus subalutaceus]|uniref:uncharacterized protein n=1 Tax=Suillus subalutaceus TaxID=48586 RepID=UPI001B86D123|nr:uncharacterized protein DFJ58DRAFT_729040 [Suillus subalutaceus]KAG1851059.1 hypothetical protein DFJ58DRAFT_729040 [Suillus subalutaceus]